MGASLAAVGEGFAASLGHVLWVAEAWFGIIVTVSAAAFAVLCLIATRGQGEPLTVAVPDDAEPGCPWCHTHACTNPALCNCAQWCGSWLCKVKEASRG
jgi:hypothetical protein